MTARLQCQDDQELARDNTGARFAFQSRRLLDCIIDIHLKHHCQLAIEMYTLAQPFQADRKRSEPRIIPVCYTLDTQLEDTEARELVGMTILRTICL